MRQEFTEMICRTINEIDKELDAEYKRGYEDGLKTLDLIRTEIELNLNDPHNYVVKQDACREVLDIIDSLTKGEEA